VPNLISVSILLSCDDINNKKRHLEFLLLAYKKFEEVGQFAVKLVSLSVSNSQYKGDQNFHF